MTINFFRKGQKENPKTGKAPISARITINGIRTEVRTGRSIEASRWDEKRKQAKGTNLESKSINEHLNVVYRTLFDHYSKLLNEKGVQPTPLEVKASYEGKTEKGKTIVEAFSYNNSIFRQKVECGENAEATYNKYETSLKHLKGFISAKYAVDDLGLKVINFQFITEFELYLRTTGKCQNDAAMKHLTHLKKVMKLSVDCGWLDRNPVSNFKIKKEQKDPEFLTEAELSAIDNKHFSIERLERVRDAFIFSCYTGLSYADICKLSIEHIVTDEEGEQYIIINRTKTKRLSRIPLLIPALLIIEKYNGHPLTAKTRKLIPMLSNQKYYAYLKEIADLCGIKKNLKSHVGRHTFGTTITAANDIQTDVIKDMMGHKSVKTTELYARQVLKKIGKQMKTVNQKYERREKAS
jgi:site-specific recombinase XerD